MFKGVAVVRGVVARHLFSTHVTEEFRGETVWDGTVEIFEVHHHNANRCYAWEYESADGRKIVATVLGVPPIKSSRAAVQAHIASGQDPGPTMD